MCNSARFKKYWIPVTLVLSAVLAFLYRMLSKNKAHKIQDTELSPKLDHIEQQTDILVTRSKEIHTEIDQSNQELEEIQKEFAVKVKPRKISTRQAVDDWNADR